jgi:hypothetical protein
MIILVSRLYTMSGLFIYRLLDKGRYLFEGDILADETWLSALSCKNVVKETDA